MTTKRVLLLPSQARAIRSEAQTLLYMGGNGCGKTETLAYFALQESLKYEENYGCVFSPSLPQLKRAAIPKIIAAYTNTLGLVEGKSFVFNKNVNEFYFPSTGSRFFLLGVEHVAKDEIEGSELGWAAGDEIAGISFEKFQAVASRVRKLNASRKIRLFGYPPSPGHWTHERFEDRNEEGDELISAATHENLICNGGFLPDDYLQILEKTYPVGTPLHTRKVKGQWAQMEGLVYPEFSAELVVEESKLPQAHHWIGGLDFGYENPLAYLKAFADGPDPSTNTIYLVGEHYKASWTYAQHAEAIGPMYVQGAPIFADHDAQGQSELSNLGVPTINAKKAVIFGIDCVRERLKDGRLKILKGACPNVVREFGLYSYPEDNARGNLPLDHPLKRDDHAMDALRYLVVGEEMKLGQSGFRIKKQRR